MSIQVPPDSTGKVVESATVAGLERQVVVVGSPTGAAMAEVDGTYGQAVDVKRSALATGAATEATLAAASAKLPAALVGGRLDVNVGASALATGLGVAANLGDGVANYFVTTLGAALQLFNGATWDRLRGDTANGLDVDVTRVGGNVATTAAASSRADGAFVTMGAQADGAAAGDTSTASYMSLFKRLLQRMTTLIGQLPSALVSGRLDVNLGAAPATVTAQLAPRTSGGLSVNRFVSAATTNATVVKASAGQLYGYIVSNAAASARYLRFYNMSTTPTAGSSTIFMGPILLPAGFTGHIEFAQGIAFGTGIALTLTTGIADTDSAAVGANEIGLTVLYS